MFESPDQQWHELSENYGRMFDGELLQVAADYNDLTDIARQALRDEMRRRGLGDPTAPRASIETLTAKPPTATRPDLQVAEQNAASTVSPAEWLRITQHYARLDDEDLEDLADDYGNLTPAAQQILSDEMEKRGLGEPTAMTEPRSESSGEDQSNPHLAAADARARSAPYHEDSMWVRLCKVEDEARARQWCEVLERADIRSRYQGSFGVYHILVAADQADRAEAILAQPIPQDVIEESQEEIPEFELPKCPNCGTEGPVLLSAEPTNWWQCEACGHEWSDAVEDPARN